MEDRISLGLSPLTTLTTPFSRPPGSRLSRTWQTCRGRIFQGSVSPPGAKAPPIVVCRTRRGEQHDSLGADGNAPGDDLHKSPSGFVAPESITAPKGAAPQDTRCGGRLRGRPHSSEDRHATPAAGHECGTTDQPGREQCYRRRLRHGHRSIKPGGDARLGIRDASREVETV